MALRTQSHVTHVGTPTCGAFSARNYRFMINGWLYSISPERITDMNDKIYEGVGISPSVKIENKMSQADTVAHIDDQLEYAFDYAKKLAGIQ